MANPIVTMRIKGMGDIRAELYPDVAPATVENFVKLAGSGFYNGLTFHRIIPGFMIQGGDPEGTGMGGPGYSIKGEFSTNGFPNPLNHTRGVLSMARSMMPDSAGSQFFIMHEDAPHLDGNYAAFGKVIEGIEVVDKVASVKTDYNDKPLEPVVIEIMSVEV
ncbi:MAG: peptidylprolyl isomerase [Clostridiales bacterium]|nr:peptidylprolyl isomerase [Clostridiales bacterium]